MWGTLLRGALDARRPLRLATAAYVLGMTAHTTFLFFLAPVALRAGGVEGRDPWVFSGTAVATMLCVLPAGRLADLHPRRRVLRASLGLLALSYLPLLAPPTLGSVLLATALSGAGLALLFVSFTSYVADLLAHGRTSGAFGVSAALATLASAAGPFVASLVFRLAPDDATALRASALLFGLGALVGILLTFRLPAVRLPPEPDAVPGAPRGRSELVAAAPFVLLYVLMGAGYGMMLPYFAVYFLDHVRLGPAAWGLLLAAATVSGALGSYAAGRLGRARPHAVMLGSQAAHAGVSLAFALPLGPLALGLAYVVRNGFATAVAPVGSALLMERARPRGRALAQGYATLAWNVGWAVGAAVGGLVLAELGGLAFPLAALPGLAGTLGAVALLRAGRASPG